MCQESFNWHVFTLSIAWLKNNTHYKSGMELLKYLKTQIPKPSKFAVLINDLQQETPIIA